MTAFSPNLVYRLGAVLVVLGWGSAPVFAGPLYRLTPAPALKNGLRSMSSDGRLAYSSNGSGYWAATYGPNAGVPVPAIGIDPTFQGNLSIAGVNASGEVTSTSTIGDGIASNTRAVFEQNGVATNLGTAPGGTRSEALGINDAGYVWGRSSYQESGPYGQMVHTSFVWKNGVMTTPAGPGGSWQPTIDSVNNAGDMLAVSVGKSLAIIRIGQSETITPASMSPVSGASMNDAGQVAASFYMGVGKSTAMLYDGGVWKPLAPNFANWEWQGVFDMNARGDVVGVLSGSAGAHGFLYSAIDGVTYDLNRLVDPSLGYQIREATKISASGLIAATATYPNGESGVVLLSPEGMPLPVAPQPVPEPAGCVAWVATIATGFLVKSRLALRPSKKNASLTG